MSLQLTVNNIELVDLDLFEGIARVVSYMSCSYRSYS